MFTFLQISASKLNSGTVSLVSFVCSCLLPYIILHNSPQSIAADAEMKVPFVLTMCHGIFLDFFSFFFLFFFPTVNRWSGKHSDVIILLTDWLGCVRLWLCCLWNHEAAFCLCFDDFHFDLRSPYSKFVIRPELTCAVDGPQTPRTNLLLQLRS